jgi:hypothetical protein
VGDPDRSWSQEFTFTTPKPSGSDPYPLRVAVIGDLGQTQDSANTLKHAQSNNPDFVLNVGDLAYADGFQVRALHMGGKPASVDLSLPVLTLGIRVSHVRGNAMWYYCCACMH